MLLLLIGLACTINDTIDTSLPIIDTGGGSGLTGDTGATGDTGDGTATTGHTGYTGQTAHTGLPFSRPRDTSSNSDTATQ